MSTFTVYLEGKAGRETSFTTKSKDWREAEDIAYNQFPRLVIVKIKNLDTGETIRF